MEVDDRSAVVFAVLGPNPAALTELLWELLRTKRFTRLETHVLVEARSKFYLDGEVLAPGGALEQLREVLDADALPDFVVHEARDEAGALIEDDHELEARAAYDAAVWNAAQAAIEAANLRPVVFGLVAGRRRTMTVFLTSLFQMTARPRDELYDVRVSDPRVEGGTGFFFPAQPHQRVQSLRGDILQADSVEVQLVPIHLIPLAPLLPSDFQPTSSTEAATKIAEVISQPELLVDLAAGEIHAYPRGASKTPESKIPLTRTEGVWYAYLCWSKRQRNPFVDYSDEEALAQFLDELIEYTWWKNLPEGSLFRKIQERKMEIEDEGNLRKTRSTTKTKVTQFVNRRGAGFRLLIPRAGKAHEDGPEKKGTQRILLAPERIELLR